METFERVAPVPQAPIQEIDWRDEALAVPLAETSEFGIPVLQAQIQEIVWQLPGVRSLGEATALRSKLEKHITDSLATNVLVSLKYLDQLEELRSLWPGAWE